MIKHLNPEVQEIIEAVHYWPSISLIMPLTAKINAEKELEQSFNFKVDEVGRELKSNYSEEMSNLMIKKLQLALKKVDLNLHKKAVAVYVSPVFEKIVYLDTAVQERIVIDESFEIRDLIYSKKRCSKYLLLLLSSKQFNIYLVNGDQFTKIETTIPENIAPYINEWPEKVANFTDSIDKNQIIVQKFLQHIDKELNRILNDHELPVFVMGVKKILGHFKKISKHQDFIADYITGNYDKLSFAKLAEILESHLAVLWHKKDKEIVQILDNAEGENKLITGIKPVWEAVMDNLGNKVFVESDFVFSAQRAAKPNMIEELTENYNEFSYIRDAVDDIIEKVILNGGDVDFVDSGTLNNYEHIALVTY
ncbi:hypothetical protein QG516_04130 [Pedobacter gandavensis]|uniref:baeRF3 domain-containing protein n=1 Tax=Pedobacter TaxID=84567 RepID=UPI001C99241B|nr:MULTISPECIES: hypothetical protein [Pedobacter]WGQ10840.1 hypothetical protein QG516_04130 [Pedobacter gandavensis]